MRHGSTRVRSAVLGAIALLSLLAIGSSTAFGAKPERGPFPGGTTPLGPGEGCGFNVTITSVPGSNYTETVFSDGRYQVTGSGHELVTNTDANPDRSTIVATSGRVTVTDAANGDTRIRASGRTLFYFYEDDEGPFGTVGSAGALYLITGHVDEILAASGFVTSFRWSGEATEICSHVE
jgi:hypothetical protein